ncbi:hypothetical protein D187_007694 [Cystobacter fuscus DSM 2262]|uniref:Uncharacterized protein n=1 Tax=Cystobacter fuscus (strain ATCC 25194 / DSM 2262 / NBRC 100088 / M29) TaxID=1242864 RepID=S9P252_CYSF2|nr:hypothetical protein D187_007694 [Cystobacter fuscus DSM 2262]
MSWLSHAGSLFASRLSAHRPEDRWDGDGLLRGSFTLDSGRP